jgi:hypothetical protein
LSSASARPKLIRLVGSSEHREQAAVHARKDGKGGMCPRPGVISKSSESEISGLEKADILENDIDLIGYIRAGANHRQKQHHPIL